jgi:hypothetical protein
VSQLGEGKELDVRRKELSYHESAHAVMCWRYSSFIGERGLRVSGWGGEAHIPELATAAEGRRLWRGSEEWRVWAWRARAEIRSLVAGRVAEHKLYGWQLPSLFEPDDDDPNNDLARVRRILPVLAGPGNPWNLEWHLIAETGVILRGSTWRAIVALASELMEGGRVSGERAFEVFRGNAVPRVRHLFAGYTRGSGW